MRNSKPFRFGRLLLNFSNKRAYAILVSAGPHKIVWIVPESIFAKNNMKTNWNQKINLKFQVVFMYSCIIVLFKSLLNKNLFHCFFIKKSVYSFSGSTEQLQYSLGCYSKLTNSLDLDCFTWSYLTFSGHYQNHFIGKILAISN